MRLRLLAIAALVSSVACADTAEPPGALGEAAQETVSLGLQAYCSANVIGHGLKAVETDYLPRVVTCENGGAPLEALKAQAVAARSYLYYKLNTSGSVADGTGDQVYSCNAQPSAVHYQAVEATAGQVVRYSGTQVAAFYVAGATPSSPTCVAVPGDYDWSNTEKYVTYNWGSTGGGVTQTTLGWVNALNYANRGCKSQNGARCLAEAGWNYKNILKFYYGADIELVTAEGACVGPNCACSGAQQQQQACGDCGTRARTCDGCSWGPWGTCGGQGACTPNESQDQACGDCGTRARTCTSSCGWSAWGSCTGQGACTAAETQEEPCGACGTRARTCASDCRWDAWGSCTGQGVCTAGEAQDEPCGACGTRTRACTSACAWSAWETCGGQGPCAAGESETEGCGSCGKRSRSCNESCDWPAWGACLGEGECSAGDMAQEACGECGLRARACSAECAWGDWSPCGGEGSPISGACDTGAPGPCGDGEWTCLEGFATCLSTVAPAVERCDGVDNDCDGEVDEGGAPLVDALPVAARLEAVDAPSTLLAGQVVTVRATFRNIGTEGWDDGALWVVADGPGGGATSLLYSDGWASGTIPGPIAGATPAGGSVTVDIEVRAPGDERVGETVVETFRLADTVSGVVRCESPAVEVSIRVEEARGSSEEHQADAAELPDAVGTGASEGGPTVAPLQDPAAAAAAATGQARGGCASGGGDGGGGHGPAPVAAFLLLAWLAIARSRARC